MIEPKHGKPEEDNDMLEPCVEKLMKVDKIMKDI